MAQSNRSRRAAEAGYWRSEVGFEAYKAAYDEAMATMPPPTRTRDVPIELGSVRVYEWAPREEGETDALPVILVPGIRSGVPMWAENLRYWLGERTLYAMDAVGDAGLSTHTVPFESFDHQVGWLEQALAGLGIEQAHVVGHSFGGAIAATHALHHAGRVRSLTLLEPVMVLHTMPLSIYLWASVLLLPLPQSWKDRALAEIGGVTIAEVQERTPMSVMIDEGSKHYAAAALTPRTLTDAEWRSMSMPIRVEIASDKSLAGGAKAAERARSLGVDPTIVRPNTTHSLPMQAAEALGRELPAYWASHDR
ncbi:alpha/beta fold hydrolase [Ruania zhangjianzhongii]|uniref:alpha/beta fold hydrolase n=1 Tax=Ruania zhangjianzhongii TaxID=2603206 RepID=UPI001C9E340B|nr:alpha/beta hydrolase [Ruania zhangjianzhongii]